MRSLTIQKVNEAIQINAKITSNAQNYYNFNNPNDPIRRDGIKKVRDRDEQIVLDRFKLK